MYNLSKFFGMDYWYDIVKSYDDPKMKAPNKKNDGTYSQSSVVILLIYLTFGEDHPYHIADYFRNSSIKALHGEKIPYSSNLTTAKVGTLLNKMKEDELVTVTEAIINGRLRKAYSINPRILQSPIKSESCSKHEDLSIVDLDSIADFVSEMEKYNCENEARNRIFKTYHLPDVVNYFTFMFFIESEATNLELRMAYIDNPWDPDLTRINSHFIRQISKYISEMKKLPNSHYDQNINYTFHIKNL